MKKRLHTKWLIVIAIAWLLPSNVAAQFSVSAELRPRTEMRYGQRTLIPIEEASPEFVTTQRTRLNFDYKNDKLKMRLTLQDARTWGDVAGRADNADINLGEAWAQISFTENLSLTVGRQLLNYDDQRLISVRNWNNISHSHDIALLKTKIADIDIHAALAYNSASGSNSFDVPYTVNNYKAMNYLWAKRAWESGLYLSLIQITDWNEDPIDFTVQHPRTTFGGNIGQNTTEGLGFGATAYMQVGTNTAGQDISAYFLSANAMYYLPKVTFTLAADYLSGEDKNNENGKVNAFNKLFGPGHKYYGYMDYFLNPDADTNGGGLTDIYARADVKTGEKTNLEITCHNFSLSGEIPSATIDLKKTLGTEIDLMLKHKYTKDISFVFGYSTMFATETMAYIKGGDYKKTAHWGWMMIMINPVLFSSEK